MSQVFLKIVNMSISASWLVLAVLVLRQLLKKAPRWIHVLLWGIVALRLLCPFSMESALSLIPSAQTVSPGIMMDRTPTIATGIAAFDQAVNPAITATFAPEPWASANPLQILIPVAAIFWLLGILAMLLYTALSYWRLCRKVATAVRLEENIFQSEFAESPFVLGIFRPRIYLSYSLDETSRDAVIAHERAHIARKDHWWKPLGFLALTLHWFNPLMWLAYVLLCRDIEMACDEKVIGQLDNGEKADYAQALVNCSTRHIRVAACPLAFGEVGVKARVKSVLHYKKPAFWLMLLALVLCAVVAVCFLTDPAGGVQNPWVQEYVPGAPGILGSVDKESYESISEDFAIGADRYGRAVFKDPHKAFRTFTVLYADGIALIREQNGLQPISARNYSAYKKLGWQTTSGPEEAQTQAGFATKFLDIYENSFTKDIPNSDTDIPTTDTATRKWFDAVPGTDSNEKLTSALPEIPGVTFHATTEMIGIVSESGTIEISGTPILNAYFSDLTGDGIPELCTTVCVGFGIIDVRVIVYDCVAGESYELADRGKYDYYLRMNEMDGCLYVELRDNSSEEVRSYGKLILNNGSLQMGGGISEGRACYFQAEILEFWDNCYLVEPVAGSKELQSADKITVPMENIETPLDPQIGDVIEIRYDGYLMESYPAQIGTVYGIRVVSQKEIPRYYFTIAEEGVYSVAYSGPLLSGGCQNADGSAFRPAETVWLEGLDGLTDLQGVTVEALDEHGHTVWSISIADTKENQGVTQVSDGLWMIRPGK